MFHELHDTKPNSLMSRVHASHLKMKDETREMVLDTNAEILATRWRMNAHNHCRIATVTTLPHAVPGVFVHLP